MATQTLAARMDNVEQRVTRLEELPARVDALALQISQLGDEMHGEFSTVRDEIRGGDEETRRTLRDEIRAGDEETRRVLRDEIRGGDEETRHVLRDEIRGGDEETRHVLRDEIRGGDEETRHVLRDEIRAGDEETRRALRDEIRAGVAEVKAQGLMLYEAQQAAWKLFDEERRANRPTE
jgi:hypothetical protein